MGPVARMPTATEKRPAPKAISRDCEPKEIAPSCTMTPELSADQRRSLYAAVEKSGAMWCGGAVVLDNLSKAPEVSGAPPSLQGKFQLELTLRNMLRGKTYPAQVKITCRAR